MICEAQVRKFCRDDISKIENYDKAIADSQTWDCHHRDEVKILQSGMTVVRSKQDLIDAGRYYDCPANELIFLTHSEHARLHNRGELHHMYGKTHSTETKRKMSTSQKGRTKSAESKQKITEGMKAYWARRKAQRINIE